jgi:SSS family transporter
MEPTKAILIVFIYFTGLFIVSLITSRKANNQSFFIGNRSSIWYVVAIGMIGTSLSGVTFISVPGDVGLTSFYYMQVVFGYLIGYLVITYVLLPVYYKLNLTSIYTYLESRFGVISYKTGASLFIISRMMGAAFRLFLVANVLQIVIFEKLGIPFYVTVIVSLLLIYVYTFKGGIKTIVWTDTLQTLFMISAVVITIVLLLDNMGLSVMEGVNKIKESGHSKLFDFTSFRSETHFVKHFFSGMFITIVMTGLDQDMMQKNLSCKSLKDAQKNVLSYSLAFIPVNLIFMAMGALLYIFAAEKGIPIPENTDNLFPIIATQGHLPGIIGVFFILGLIAAAYSSADSALTALTTSVLIDIIGVEKDTESYLRKKRLLVHFVISLVLAVIIILFKALQSSNVISALLKVAGFTYGPLLGMYSFGFYTKKNINEKHVPVLALISIVSVFILNKYSESLFWGYKMGFEVLIYNGLIMFLLMYLSSFLKKRV